MGYRIEIGTIDFESDEISFPYYGTKYYGYVDLDESLSYKFLQCINKFDGDEWFRIWC